MDWFFTALSGILIDIAILNVLAPAVLIIGWFIAAWVWDYIDDHQSAIPFILKYKWFGMWHKYDFPIIENGGAYYLKHKKYQGIGPKGLASVTAFSKGKEGFETYSDAKDYRANRGLDDYKFSYPLALGWALASLVAAGLVAWLGIYAFVCISLVLLVHVCRNARRKTKVIAELEEVINENKSNTPANADKQGDQADRSED